MITPAVVSIVDDDWWHNYSFFYETIILESLPRKVDKNKMIQVKIILEEIFLKENPTHQGITYVQCQREREYLWMIWQEEDEANKRISRKVKYLSIVIIIIILIRVVFQLPYYRIAFRKVNPGP